jgi:general secretion pathway protein D
MMRRCNAALAVALLLSLCAAAAPPVWADAVAPAPEVSLNFQNVEIPVLAKFIGDATGKNFLVDEKVRGTVSVVSSTKVSPERAYQIFQSVLQLKGFTIEQDGAVLKIVPSSNVIEVEPATETATEPVTEPATPVEEHADESGEFVTRLVTLRNVDANSMVAEIQPMISHGGSIAAFPDGNSLIITDDAYNIQHLLEIVDSHDVEGQSQSIEVIPLQFAFADKVASRIDEVLRGAAKNPPDSDKSVKPAEPDKPDGSDTAADNVDTAAAGIVTPASQPLVPQYKVLADERSNSIIAAGAPMEMKQIHDIIANLDVHPPDAEQRIHVYRLKNAAVAEVLPVLDGLLGEAAGAGDEARSIGKGSLGRGLGYGGGMNSGFGGGYGITAGDAASGSGSIKIAGNAERASSSATPAEFSDQVTVTADAAANALVVSAAPKDWESLLKVIAEIDVPRTQVFLQAIVVEVSPERQRNLGVRFSASESPADNALGLGTINFVNLQDAIGSPLGLRALGPGLAAGSLCVIPAPSEAAASGAVMVNGNSMAVPCDIALIEALKSDPQSRVLSAPTLLTADNTEASIVIGETVPFAGASAPSAGLPGQIFNRLNRQNVGITLDVVPRISGDYVRMDLHEEVSNVQDVTASSPLGPTNTIRSASTTVLIQDRRTVVIGGMRSHYDVQRTGTPWFAHLPVIGKWFRKAPEKQDNLLVFLTPHVVRNQADLHALAQGQRPGAADPMSPGAAQDIPQSFTIPASRATREIPSNPAMASTDPTDSGAASSSTKTTAADPAIPASPAADGSP